MVFVLCILQCLQSFWEQRLNRLHKSFPELYSLLLILLRVLDHTTLFSLPMIRLAHIQVGSPRVMQQVVIAFAIIRWVSGPALRQANVPHFETLQPLLPLIAIHLVCFKCFFIEIFKGHLLFCSVSME